eukprot:5208945-Amphidinium_carterae.1
MGGEALLDSGASHVILPLESLDETEKGDARPVHLHLASGVNQGSWILSSEVFAEKVRRVLLPLGRLVKQTGVIVLWSSAHMLLLATCDRTDALHVISRAKLRQGSMPHVSIAVANVLRQALKDTRNASRVIPFSEWVQ